MVALNPLLVALLFGSTAHAASIPYRRSATPPAHVRRAQATPPVVLAARSVSVGNPHPHPPVVEGAQPNQAPLLRRDPTSIFPTSIFLSGRQRAASKRRMVFEDEDERELAIRDASPSSQPNFTVRSPRPLRRKDMTRSNDRRAPDILHLSLNGDQYTAAPGIMFHLGARAESNETDADTDVSTPTVGGTPGYIDVTKLINETLSEVVAGLALAVDSSTNKSFVLNASDGDRTPLFLVPEGDVAPSVNASSPADVPEDENETETSGDEPLQAEPVNDGELPAPVDPAEIGSDAPKDDLAPVDPDNSTDASPAFTSSSDNSATTSDDASPFPSDAEPTEPALIPVTLQLPVYSQSLARTIAFCASYDPTPPSPVGVEPCSPGAANQRFGYNTVDGTITPLYDEGTTGGYFVKAAPGEDGTEGKAETVKLVFKPAGAAAIVPGDADTSAPADEPELDDDADLPVDLDDGLDDALPESNDAPVAALATDTPLPAADADADTPAPPSDDSSLPETEPETPTDPSSPIEVADPLAPAPEDDSFKPVDVAHAEEASDSDELSEQLPPADGTDSDANVSPSPDADSDNEPEAAPEADPESGSVDADADAPTRRRRGCWWFGMEMC